MKEKKNTDKLTRVNYGRKHNPFNENSECLNVISRLCLARVETFCGRASPAVPCFPLLAPGRRRRFGDPIGCKRMRGIAEFACSFENVGLRRAGVFESIEECVEGVRCPSERQREAPVDRTVRS